MTDIRDEAIQRIRTAIGSMAVLREQTVTSENSARTVLAVLEDGGTVADSFAAAGASESRGV